MYSYVLFYLLILNAAAFLAAAFDKLAAKRRVKRVPERTLFFLAAIGGTVGLYSAMFLFRHKTKHKRFVIGVPVIFTAQLVIACYIVHNLT